MRKEQELRALFATDPVAAHVGLALLVASCSSATASDSTESVARLSGLCLTSYNEVDVSAFRAAVASIPSSSDRTWLHLLHASLFSPASSHSSSFSTPSPLFTHASSPTSSLFSNDDQKGRLSLRLTVPNDPPPGRTVFHGSHPSNWLSITHCGLRCAALAHNGRVYGDGVYVAKTFATAASFSPMTAVEPPLIFGARYSIRALCVVGEFRLVGYDEDAQRERLQMDIPPEYLVVTDPNQLQLVQLHVLCTMHQSPRKQGAQRTGTSEGRGLSSISGFGVLVLAYLLWIAWIGYHS